MSVKRVLTGVVWGVTGMVLLGIAVVAMAQQAWEFKPPAAGDTLNRTYVDVATYVVKVGEAHPLCWGNNNITDGGLEETALQLAYRRYRVEGGPMEVSNVIQFKDWVPQKDESGAIIPTRYCKQSTGPKKAGHWIYEARMCRSPLVSEASDCSPWISSVVPDTPEGGGGVVDGKPKGWWIYAYLPAPTGAGVT